VYIRFVPSSSAIIYLRLSVDTDASTSIKRQEAECRSYCQRLGLPVAEVFTDLDVSGYSTGIDRPELAKALAAVEAGASHLVVYRIDRLARSVVTFHQVVARLQERGAVLISVSENLDMGTATGRLVASILSVFAEFESDSISSRVKSARRHLASEGKWVGRVPFGWVTVPHESGRGFVLAPDPVAAVEVEGMFEAVAGGDRLAAVAADLNRRGVKTSTGNDWVGETVRKVMANRRNADLVGADLFVQAQPLLKRGAPSARVPGAVDPLLPRELIRCGNCGAPMTQTHLKKGDRRRRVYRCSARPGPGVPGCTLVASADGVEEAVASFLLDSFGHLAVFDASTSAVFDPAAEERAALEARITQLDEERFIGGAFDGPGGVERYASLLGQLQEALGSLPSAELVEVAPTLAPGETFSDAWEASTRSERAAWISSAVAVVEVSKGRGGRNFDSGRVQIVLKS
jgi:site-specific DNA recombinase